MGHLKRMQIIGARKTSGQTYFGITTAELVQPAIKAFEAEYEIRVTDPNLAVRMDIGMISKSGTMNVFISEHLGCSNNIWIPK